jgi:hypothetical protein
MNTVLGYRYWLTLDGGKEHEVSKEEWVRAERAAGFHNTMGHYNDPGTASWSAMGNSGRIEYVLPGKGD